MIIENHFLCTKSNWPFFTPGKVYLCKRCDDFAEDSSYSVRCNNGYEFYINGGDGTKIMAFDYVIAEFEQLTDAEFEEIE